MTDTDIDEVKRAQADDNVDDDAETDETVIPIKYSITSFGADYDAEGLVKRLQREDIYIPPFQRSFVWTQKEASRFIESLLLGLPVPGIFLARDTDTKKLLVIDGQQRLRSIQYFFEGYFNPDPNAKSKTVFRLLNVQKQWDGHTIDSIGESDRIMLRDTIIHSTIVQQDSPDEVDKSSIYHIFERLNTTGRKLSPQQIRVAIYHGKFLDLLNELNEYQSWRHIFGKKSKTLRDQEFILRFLALLFNRETYGDTEDTNTMKGFLNTFTFRNRNCDQTFCEQASLIFNNTIDIVIKSLSEKAFRPERALNAAVFDSVMVGIAKRLEHGNIENTKLLKTRYSKLILDSDYVAAISHATSNEKSVKSRCSKAIKAFSNI